MRLETFFAEFDHLTDAPNAVRKLRNLLLRWSVQGKLVAQDPSDEPASKLIADAVIARRELVTAGVVRAQPSEIGFVTRPHNDLPAGWVLAPLSVYVGVIMGQSPPSSTYNRVGEGLPFYQGKAQFGRLYPTPTDWCTEPTKVGQPGDVVISVRAPVGPTNMLTEKSCIGRGLAALRSLGGDQMHLLYTLRAFERTIAALGVGSTFTAIAKHDLDHLLIPVPPLAEQRRIVAKLGELMALCDRLEAQQQELEARRDSLAEASLSRFAHAPTPANLEFLFHTSYAVPPAELRESILTLAAEGRLVPAGSKSIVGRLASVLSEASINGVSKGPCTDASATEILRISAGTSRRDFYVNEDDFKHVDLPSSEIAKYRLAPNDLLACRFNGNLHYVGRFSVYRGESRRVQVNPDKLIRFRVDAALHSPRYVCLAMNAPPTRLAIEAMCATTAGNIGLSAGKLKTVALRLPSLEEQTRIVAKVDQLMALVDQLEGQLATSRATGDRLLEASVAELSNLQPA